MLRSPPGFYGTGTAQAFACMNDSFSDKSGREDCTPCSTLGSNLKTMGPGASSASQCVCKAGFYARVPITNPPTGNLSEPCAACKSQLMNCSTNRSGEWQTGKRQAVHGCAGHACLVFARQNAIFIFYNSLQRPAVDVLRRQK